MAFAPAVRTQPLTVSATAQVTIPPALYRDLLRRTLPYLAADPALSRDVRAALGLPLEISHGV